MRLPQIIFFLLGLFTAAHAFAIPSLSQLSSTSQDLFKRKGGGGGGGKGGGGSSSSSSSSGSSGSSSSSGSSGSSSGSRGGSSSSGSSGSSSSGSSGGFRSSGGSGVPPSYGGGRYYGGGSPYPYSPGSATPGGLASRGLLLGGAAGLALFPAAYFAYGAYAYAYPHPWHYYNTTSNTNTTMPVECVCARYEECGCDETNDDQSYIQDAANNATIAKVANVNGTQTLILDGTLQNGTTAATGAGMPSVAMSSTGWLLLAAGFASSVLVL